VHTHKKSIKVYYKKYNKEQVKGVLLQIIICHENNYETSLTSCWKDTCGSEFWNTMGIYLKNNSIYFLIYLRVHLSFEYTVFIRLYPRGNKKFIPPCPPGCIRGGAVIEAGNYYPHCQSCTSIFHFFRNCYTNFHLSLFKHDLGFCARLFLPWYIGVRCGLAWTP